MTRSAAVALALIALGAVLVVAGSTQGITPTPYAPVPPSAFSTWPIAPLARPIRVEPSPSPTFSPTAKPVSGSITPSCCVVGPSISGVATFYAYNAGQAAAAKPLRDYLGAGWRGAFARVCHYGLCLRIRLTDSEASLIPGRLIDLSSQDFRRICGPLSQGICEVEVS